MQKCSEVMTQDVVRCLPGDKVTKVAQLMKGRNIGSIPVIENDVSRKLVGIVTDRDLALEIVAEGRDPKKSRVEEVMTRSVLTCHEDDSLEQALEAMSTYQLRRIPIVDYDDRLIGIIAQADVATRLDQPEKTASMVREISQPGVSVLTR